MEHGYGGHPYPPPTQQQFAAAPPPPALHGAPPPPPPQFPQPGSQAFFAPPPMQFAYPSVPYPFVPPPAAPLQPPSHVPQGFFNPWEPPPPIVPPPADNELQKRIEKLVEYAAKNGPEFEKMLKEKQKDNPAYAFLFGAEGHNYYRYKLWITVNPHLGGFNTPMPPLNPALPPLNPALSPALPSFNPNPLAPLNPNLNSPLNTSLNGPLPSVQVPPNPVFPPFYDQQQLHHHHQQPPPSQYFEPVPQETYEETGSKPFKGLSGPLPTDVGAELQGVLENLTGTKESIKGAKNWFMQRSPFAPALAEALRDRVLALDDDIRQLHVIYLANDILFDSLQRRIILKEPDNEALAFQPVLGPMLAAIYHNPQNKEANQTRLQKILQFWGSKEVYNREIISVLENEMIVRPPVGYRIPLPLSAPQTDHSSLLPSSNSTLLPTSSSSLLALPGSAAGASLALEPTIGNEQIMVSSPEPSQTAHSPSEQEHRTPLAALSAADQYGSTPGVTPLATQQFVANSVPTVYPTLNSSFLNSLSTSTPSMNQPTLAQLPSLHAADHPPYPLFPPGLIPGMVRKMQIGSGVPYSPLSPLDIPAVIPPSTASDSYTLDRVTKFFKEIGEVDPLEGQSKGAVVLMDEDEREEKERSRIGGACIPPPANLHVDVETNTLPDGSMEHKPGSVSTGRLGLGAVADPNEVTQYDDVYTSYRKQRSTNYHTSMSARAAAR